MKLKYSWLALALSLSLVLPWIGCSTEDDVETVEETPSSSQGLTQAEAAVPPPTIHLAALPPSATISYADSVDWLEMVPAEEQDDQIRDWSVLGLAGLLKIDTETLRNFSYDRTPIRDPLFTDIATESVGPGRFLPDGSGTLHLLVLLKDPYAARTVGMLLDDYRKDAGSDPEKVRVHHYTIDHKKKTVRVETGPSRLPGDVRAENGYIEMAVQDLPALEIFLKKTQHLSKVENRDGTLWASGWSWPGAPAGKITSEDIAVLQQGYLHAKNGLDSEPGFSLDPGEPVQDQDLLSLLKAAGYSRAPEVLGELRELMEAAEPLDEDDPRLQDLQARADRLASQDPELAKLIGLHLKGGPPYQNARYEGGVKGTEVGMTYFYTDLVAKAWLLDKGDGVPTGKVPGFVSSVNSITPLGHCTSPKQGRLWFGLREEGVRAYEDRIELGSLTTRLFSRVDDENNVGKEVEPSYSFGRGMWWWDRHYIAMADYEPQYHRLDQLMRWGSIVAWLVNHGKISLPEPSREEERPDLNFFNWLQANPDLRWHWKIPVVYPAGLNSEALLMIFSRAYPSCGGIRYLAGGISGPERAKISSLESSIPNLEANLARARARLEETRFSTAYRAGTIASEKVAWRLDPIRDGITKIEVVADGRRVWSLSGLKAWVGENVKRRISLAVESTGKRLTQRVTVQGVEMGELSVRAEGTVATVTWKPSMLDRARRALSALQEKLPSQSVQEAAAQAKGASLVYTDPRTGGTFLRVDGASESRWMAIEQGAKKPGAEMAFRLGKPGEPGTEPTWYTARFTDPPVIKDATGAPSKWLNIETGSGGPAKLSGAPGPPGPPSSAEVLAADFGGEGPKKGQLYFYAKRTETLARSDDPVFGLHGTREGHALLDPRAAQQWKRARQAAKSSGDGYARPILLPDSRDLGMVYGDRITLVPEGHPFHERVQQALRHGKADGDSLVKIDGPQAFLVDGQPKIRLERSSETKSSTDLLALLRLQIDPNSPRGPPTFFEAGLAKEVLENGKIPMSPTGKEVQVHVVTAQLTDGTPESADLLAWDRAEWTQPSNISSPPVPKATRTVRLVYRSNDCDQETHPQRCTEGL
ncbi:MAG TPA: hypothetical protein VKK31_22165 [Thermoanaerobaculia bacterium]|nr:hypothetical protein [Thermoanaerobaculia bacterium]